MLPTGTIVVMGVSITPNHVISAITDPAPQAMEYVEDAEGIRHAFGAPRRRRPHSDNHRRPTATPRSSPAHVAGVAGSNPPRRSAPDRAPWRLSVLSASECPGGARPPLPVAPPMRRPWPVPVPAAARRG